VIHSDTTPPAAQAGGVVLSEGCRALTSYYPGSRKLVRIPPASWLDTAWKRLADYLS
jgi:hypothetical protein